MNNIGDKIMVLFKKLHETLKPGDKIVIRGIDYNYKTTFYEWIPCKWQNANSDYKDCRSCNGYMIITGNKNICTGSNTGYSNVIKIIKNNDISFLEDSLFKL